MKKWILISAIFFGNIVLLCYGENFNKTAAVADVFRKICNITSTALKDATDTQKALVLQKLEDKLYRAAKFLHIDGHAYVKSIMNGVRSMSMKGDYTICRMFDHATKNQMTTSTTEENPTNELIMENPYLLTNYTNNTIHFRRNPTKQTLLREMVNKLGILVKKSFQSARTSAEKHEILEKLKTRVFETLKKKHNLDFRNNISYSDVIINGIKSMMKNENDLRRIFTVNLDKSKPDLLDEGLLQNRILNDDYVDLAAHFRNSDLKNRSYLLDSVTMSSDFQSLTKAGNGMDCKGEVDNICYDLNKIGEFFCSYDDTRIAVIKVCDGYPDCPDGTDEKDCAKIAVSGVRKATQIMQKLTLFKTCFPALVTDNIISTNGKLLTDVLKNELAFIMKYKSIDAQLDKSGKTVDLQTRSVNQIANEVAIILSSFSLALNSGLCHEEDDPNEIFKSMHRAYEDHLEKSTPEAIKMLLKSCQCKGQFCADKECILPCRRVCFQKYSLTRWSCQAVNGGASVSLDVVCDGNLDCYDESDEIDCAINSRAAKFDASKIFVQILKNLQIYAIQSKEYEPMRKKFILLHDAIKVLQARSMKPTEMSGSYKKLRDKCFNTLVSIYDDVLDTEFISTKTEAAFDYLASTNNKLVAALKRSGTGNEALISPDGCLCRGSICSSRECSKKCIRTCAARPKLTRFNCNSDSEFNTSVPIEALCNGKPNCPAGEDELKCSKEPCRGRHILDLRNKLQGVGDRHEGTVLGEVLKSWKTRVTSILTIAEKRQRATPYIFKETVKEVLENLVHSYASLEDYKKTNSDQILKKFERLSQRIIEYLKTCSI